LTEGSGINLSVNLGRIKLKNPVVTCSGTFSSGLEYSEFYDVGILGAVTTKSFSLGSRAGNPPPRIWETACGMLNSIGLQNEGIDFFIKNHLPEIKSLGAGIILSIFGDNLGEFKKIARKVKKIESSLLAVELNLSCPNVKEGGIAFSSMPAEVEKITEAVCKILEIPLIVKLSPNSDSIIESAARAKCGGAEAVSIINSIVGTAIDIDTFKPRLGNITGGMSGPAIKPIALAKVYFLAKANILPIIGMGGICDWSDAVEFLVAGASAIGVGTANFVDYEAGKKIIDGIRNYLNKKGINDINKIIGKAIC